MRDAALSETASRDDGLRAIATSDALRQLETELSHPSSFDEGVEAARNACAAGASIAAAAIAAAAYYDNPLTGLGALRELMVRLQDAPSELAHWTRALAQARHAETDDHFTPGFGFVMPDRAARTLAACRRLVERVGARSAPRCAFALEHQHHLAEVAGPLNETGLAALAYLDAGVDVESAERRWLEARLSVALAEAQRARRAGIAAFPFSFGSYVYDGPSPKPTPLDLHGLKQRLGLEACDG